MESLVYKADEVASMLKCSRSKAYNIINKMNEILIKEKKINKNCSFGAVFIIITYPF